MGGWLLQQANKIFHRLIWVCYPTMDHHSYNGVSGLRVACEWPAWAGGTDELRRTDYCKTYAINVFMFYHNPQGSPRDLPSLRLMARSVIIVNGPATCEQRQPKGVYIALWLGGWL